MNIKEGYVPKQMHWLFIQTSDQVVANEAERNQL